MILRLNTPIIKEPTKRVVVVAPLSRWSTLTYLLENSLAPSKAASLPAG